MILLTILKIIGICILAILAILLLILLTLLFVPVRYRSVGKLGKEDRRVMAKVSWLASAVQAVVNYRDGKLSWAIRIFGIQILPKEPGSEEKKQQHPEPKGHANEKESTSDSKGTTWKQPRRKGTQEKPAKKYKHEITENQEPKDDSEKTEKTAESYGSEVAEKPAENYDFEVTEKPSQRYNHEASGSSAQIYDSEVTEKSERKNGSEATENPKRKDDPKATENPEQKYDSVTAEGPDEEKDSARSEKTDEDGSGIFSHFFHGIRERFQKIRDQITRTLERVKNLRIKLQKSRKTAERWKKFYHMEETTVTLGALKTETKRLISYLMPTHIRARIHFGFKDPADTGITLGIISAIYGFFPKGIELEPDFEEQVLEGEWSLRGRIRLAYFVRLALRLLLRRENRMTYRRLRKLLAKAGN